MELVHAFHPLGFSSINFHIKLEKKIDGVRGFFIHWDFSSMNFRIKLGMCENHRFDTGIVFQYQWHIFYCLVTKKNYAYY